MSGQLSLEFPSLLLKCFLACFQLHKRQPAPPHAPQMKGLMLKLTTPLLALKGAEAGAFLSALQTSVVSLALWATHPRPRQWRQSSQRQTGGDWFRY